jgi:hypothetical protein
MAEASCSNSARRPVRRTTTSGSLTMNGDTSARPPPQTELARASDLAEVDYADPPSPGW